MIYTKKMKKIGLYPGSFDPITRGHMDIINKALLIFDEIVVAVAKNSSKTCLFELSERVELISQIYQKNKAITCVGLEEKLATTLASEVGAHGIIRGLRAMSDFEYEFQIAKINRSQSPEVESIFFAASDDLTFVSSSMVKEIALYRGKIEKFVDPIVQRAIKRKFT